MDWLESHEVYPIEIYINGVCYEIQDVKSKMFFCLGQEIIYNIMKEINNEGL
jgi:hypothetical protein